MDYITRTNPTIKDNDFYVSRHLRPKCKRKLEHALEFMTNKPPEEDPNPQVNHSDIIEGFYSKSETPEVYFINIDR